MADTVVTVSEGAKADLTVLGVRASQIRVVPNPVLTADFYTNAQEFCSHPWLSPNMPPVIISAGRLEKAKDFHTLIRAFSILRSKRDAKLIILGEGSERNSLTQLVSSLGLPEHVDLHGFVDNPHKYIKRAKVFALSSAWEGLPTVLIEALACGVAIVSTDCKSGPREILLDGRLGALVPVGAAKALSEALEVALIAPSIPTAEKCLSRFSVETSVNQYMAVVGAQKHAPS
jgi:glycosyltransferase involved in cell wall biosynthesis